MYSIEMPYKFHISCPMTFQGHLHDSVMNSRILSTTRECGISFASALRSVMEVGWFRLTGKVNHLNEMSMIVVIDVSSTTY